MSSDLPAICVIATITAMAGCFLGGMAGYQNGCNQGVTTMQRQAVEHGYGEHNRRAKINWKIVRHLRASFAKKPPDMPVFAFCRSWAAMFGLKPDAVLKIVRRQSWQE